MASILDEGVDLPAAHLGIILAASQSRRQMVQRMGRVLRRKADGRFARFVIAYVVGTSEDPGEGAHGAFLEDINDVADFPGRAALKNRGEWAASSKQPGLGKSFVRINGQVPGSGGSRQG